FAWGGGPIRHSSASAGAATIAAAPPRAARRVNCLRKAALSIVMISLLLPCLDATTDGGQDSSTCCLHNDCPGRLRPPQQAAQRRVSGFAVLRMANPVKAWSGLSIR